MQTNASLNSRNDQIGDNDVRYPRELSETRTLLRGMMWIAGAVLGLYAIVCLVMFAAQRSLQYFPQNTRMSATSTDFAIESCGVTLRGWVLAPDAGDPILYFGGNAEDVSDNRSSFSRLFPGRSVYLVAYRGYGASDGTPTESALFTDSLAEFDRVAQLHPGQPISVIGRSLGTGVASYLASQRPVAKVALVTPFDSVTRVAQYGYPWLPVGLLLLDRFDSVTYLHRYRGPLLILRADDDEVIPPFSTDRLIAGIARDVEVVHFPFRGHGDISDDARYGPALVSFFNRR